MNMYHIRLKFRWDSDRHWCHTLNYAKYGVFAESAPLFFHRLDLV